MMTMSRLFILLRDLVAWTALATATRNAAHRRTGAEAVPAGKGHVPNLRPHTMMIDLLFGALMLFAFQIGGPVSEQVIPHQFDLPTADRKAGTEPTSLLPLTPVRAGKGWLYETPEGKRLTPADVVVLAGKRKATPVLLVPETTTVQDYLDAEQPLRLRGLKAGLAVAVKGGTP